MLYTLQILGCIVVAARFRHECMEIANPMMSECCRSPVIYVDEQEEKYLIHQCVHRRSTDCEIHLCFAKHRDYLNPDGTINKTGLEKEVKLNFKNDPAMFEKIRPVCFDRDVSDYPPDDAPNCEVLKIKQCLHAQYLLQCTRWWLHDRECVDIAKKVKQCRGIL